MTQPLNHDDLVAFWLVATWLGGIIPAAVLFRYTVLDDANMRDIAMFAFVWPVVLAMTIIIWPVTWYQTSDYILAHGYRDLTDCEREARLQNGRIVDNRAYEAIYPEMPLRTTQEAR